MTFLDALEAVLTPDADRFIRDPIALQEMGKGSRSLPTRVLGAQFAIRVHGNDHLKLLRGAPETADGYCNLPDYFLFAERPPTKKVRHPVVQVMLVEMKSSRPKELARRQIQLGVAALPYLIALARLDSPVDPPAVEVCGVLLWPLPPMKGRGGLAGANYAAETDPRVEVPIYAEVPCGAPLDMAHFDYAPARIGRVPIS